MASKIRIAPSLLAANFAAMGVEAQDVIASGADWLHLDVMDGHFVPNISFGPDMLRGLRPLTEAVFDTHLMISPVDPYIDDFAAAGADIITIHGEAGPHLHRSLQHIRSLGKKAGLAINPGTPLDQAGEVLDLLDLILVMTVNPGFGGQAFIESQLEKIAAARAMIDATGREIFLQADGGINAETAPRAIAAGADVLVAGSAIFKQADRKAAIDALRRGA